MGKAVNAGVVLPITGLVSTSESTNCIAVLPLLLSNNQTECFLYFH